MQISVSVTLVEQPLYKCERRKMVSRKMLAEKGI